MWVLFSLVDSGFVVYERFVRTMTEDEREAYWADFRVVGNLFGLADDEMPATVSELDDYRELMYASGRLHVSDWARETALDIVFRPPVPLWLRPLVEVVNYVTIDLLPPDHRLPVVVGPRRRVAGQPARRGPLDPRVPAVRVHVHAMDEHDVHSGLRGIRRRGVRSGL